MSDLVTTESTTGFRADRARLIADDALDGAAVRHALTRLADNWLTSVYDDALRSTGIDGAGLALMALGSYGRSELCPGSDLDLLVISQHGGDDAAEVAQGVWYPVWDTGVHLGHSVRSISAAVGIVGDDVASATAMLDARCIAGDADVAAELSARVAAAWGDHLASSGEWLRTDASARRAGAGDVAFSVEPNLKIAGGGLRDAQIPGWIARGDTPIGPEDHATLDQAKSFLLDVRVALHRCGPTAGDVLRLEDQDAVAAALAIGDADELMTEVAGAARRVIWVLDEVWDRYASQAGPHRRRHSRRDRSTVDDRDDFDVADPAGVLREVTLAARNRHRLGRPLLARLASTMPAPTEPWDTATRDAFVDLLLVGSDAIDIIETLDHVGVWERFVPEWPVVRTRAQRTTHHRFTVDRHLLETAANAATLAHRVARPDLLVIASLLHDLGKGRGGNHTAIGVDLAAQIAPRMGFGPQDTAVLVALVRYHLLLPEVATRRDIGDGATIDAVATAVGSTEVLELLSALTEADARATGPTAWSDWKAGLVTTLVERTAARLAGASSEQYGPMFPSVDQLLLLRAGVTTVRGEGRTLTVVAADRPRLFCRVTGALVLAGLNVVSAAVTTADGMALEEFTVTPAFANAELAATIEIDWPKVTAEVERAMTGRMAIAARVAERADTYRRRHHLADDGVRIRFDDSSGDDCIVEVDAPDAVGLLYAVTRALGDLDVDIRFARVETQTDRVIDAFSIVDSNGDPITDATFRDEIERAVRHAVTG